MSNQAWIITVQYYETIQQFHVQYWADVLQMVEKMNRIREEDEDMGITLLGIQPAEWREPTEVISMEEFFLDLF